jgi:endonuclease/exonuclease/phosphatase family metal-dependent hydrolase
LANTLRMRWMDFAYMYIRIVTINTWKCNGDYYARRELLADQLKKLNANIIACQECFQTSDGEVDTARFLADRLQLSYSWLPGRYKQRSLQGQWKDSYSGLAVLSAFPFSRQEGIDLPGAPGDEDRKAQHIVIEIQPGKYLSLTNIHLTHLRDGAALRKIQLETILHRIDRVKADCRLICGDFNDVSGSPALQFLQEEAGAKNCFITGKEPKRTLIYEDSLCVDHVFRLPVNGDNGYAACIQAGVVLNQPDPRTGLYPSDHFGICVDLQPD